MAFFLGIDAGGTKTTCALADGSKILSRAEGGSIKVNRVASADAANTIASLLREASTRFPVPLDQIASTCIGIAGLRFPTTRPWIEGLLPTLVGGVITVIGDEEIALDAAFPGAPGVLIVAGTGSNILGRGRSGRTFDVGGWGPAIGDEGSGYWIGRRALNAAFRALDRGEPTQLIERIQQCWSAATLEDVVATANEKPGPDLSQLAPLTVEAAAAGDTVATRVLIQAGHSLAESALLAWHKIQSSADSVENLDPLLDAPLPGIAFTGGILRHATLVRESMIAALRTSLPTAHILQKAVDPLEGAIWRARHAVAARN
jgi:glucosamine kinase